MKRDVAAREWAGREMGVARGESQGGVKRWAGKWAWLYGGRRCGRGYVKGVVKWAGRGDRRGVRRIVGRGGEVGVVGGGPKRRSLELIGESAPGSSPALPRLAGHGV